MESVVVLPFAVDTATRFTTSIAPSPSKCHVGLDAAELPLGDLAKEVERRRQGGSRTKPNCFFCEKDSHINVTVKIWVAAYALPSRRATLAVPRDVATETDTAGRTLRSWIVTARVAGSAANVPFVEMLTAMRPLAKSCVYAHVVHACWLTR